MTQTYSRRKKLTTSAKDWKKTAHDEKLKQSDHKIAAIEDMLMLCSKISIYYRKTYQPGQFNFHIDNPSNLEESYEDNTGRSVSSSQTFIASLRYG